jgi:hypothetical protein
MFEKLINLFNNKAPICVGCPAHVLANCLHHAKENLNTDSISISMLFESNK